ncbi:MAG: dihydroneopterin aldolase [Clostridia bacterium]|jgi:dihydroneopterin aldolase|nr:dihydroneopterin aldolase [Clostridia bacterium]
MDKILLKNLSFYGYHGVLEEENKLGQKFIINAVLYVDLEEACSSDSVYDTVNYAEVFEIIQYHATIMKYKLIEALAQNIINEIFQKHKRVQEIEITVKKPEAPVNGIYDYLGVEIRRRRNA